MSQAADEVAGLCRLEEAAKFGVAGNTSEFLKLSLRRNQLESLLTPGLIDQRRWSIGGDERSNQNPSIENDTHLGDRKSVV